MLPKRVNYGCGPHLIPGWLNVDIAGPHIKEELLLGTTFVDLAHCHPFPDEWFEWGYSQDFVPRLSQQEAILFLYECYRTFQVGGVLRLSFPSLAGVMRHYLSDADSGNVEYGIWAGYDQWRMKCYWSEAGLREVAEHIGFSVRTESYGVSDHTELARIDTRAHQKLINLYMELTKENPDDR